MSIAVAFAIVTGVLTVVKDVIGIDISLTQDTPGKTPITAIVAPAPPPVVVAPPPDMMTAPPAGYVAVYDFSNHWRYEPIRTMHPIWSPGDPR